MLPVKTEAKGEAEKKSVKEANPIKSQIRVAWVMFQCFLDRRMNSKRIC